MIKVLFVCLGNICRSPMAEAVFRQMVEERGLSQEFQINSAATSGWEVGNAPHRGTQKILKQHDISYAGMHSTRITQADFYEYDVILAMDQANINDLLRIAPAETKNKIHLFLSLDEKNPQQEVPDPYYTGDFQLTYDLVRRGCALWLDKLLAEK